MTAARVPIGWAERSDLIEALRLAGDPEADDVIARYDATIPEVGRDDLFPRVAAHAAGAPEASDAMIDAYLKAQPPWPDWADEDLVRAGQRFFRERQWSLQLGFLLGSLPLSYCGASGAVVLRRTGHLELQPKRRIFETATLMAEAAQDGQLAVGGRAYLMLRRLRLLHGVVRRTIEVHEFDQRRPGERVPWDEAAHGRPVNQLEILGTLWTFALTSLDVLDRSEVHIDPEERAAWLHLWNLVGHLLGIGEVGDERLLPMAEDEARACFAAIQEREFRPSPEGQELARHLLDLVRELMPGRRADHFVDGSVRLYIGHRWADVLGVAEADPRGLFGPMRFLWRHPGRWGGRLRRPVRRRLSGLNRRLLTTVSERLASEDVRTLRETEADELLREQLDRLVEDAEEGWVAVPQPERRRRSQR